MKFNFKSKLGFTLIELLVVIGILAVLAAIAIPSVAGLIDRANVSADATNSNEMTNAVERFVSEYELYVQDIASGRLDTSNLDSAQGRVYNVTGVTDRAGIEALEKDATAGVDTTGKAIYRDTKYPVNAETMQAVVENYMKTSSTTFTPKQSDCHYYYSPDCGLVVCTETEKSDVTDLNALVQSGKDAKGKDLSVSTKWIDLTECIATNNGTNTPSINLNHNGIIPEGGLYIRGLELGDNCETCGYFRICACNAEIFEAGDTFPSDVQNNDVYKYKGYDYIYNSYVVPCSYTCSYLDSGPWDCGYVPLNGWSAGFNSNSGYSEINTILETINGKNVTSMQNAFCFSYLSSTLPNITVPKHITNVTGFFMYLENNQPEKTFIPCHCEGQDMGDYNNPVTSQVEIYHYEGCGH